MPELSQLYKIDNKPIILTPSQQKIFDTITLRQTPRNQIIAPTQYGKSLTVGIACLTSAVADRERYTILAPSQKKALIIMSYVIEHCFDRTFILGQLELDKSESLDRLKRERSREKIIFKEGGGVQVLTLDARNKKRSTEAAMGFGSKNVIEDEASLIDDPLNTTVLRMLGGYDYKEQFFLKIGNPFHRNHFYNTWYSDEYNKIFIDYHTALKEGRYSQQFINEMKNEAFFDVLYECKFPDEDAIDELGYRMLITLEQLDAMFTDSPTKEGELKLGVDIGGGGDLNVYILRNDKTAWVESTNKSSDTMTNVTEIQRILKENPDLKPENVFIDDTGVGRGVSDRCEELGLGVNGVTVGAKAQQDTKFKNIKAESFWAAKVWLKGGGKLVRDSGFKQLAWIKYKVATDKLLQIEPKEQLLKRVGKSPDYADAFMLTFVQSPTPVLMFS